MEKSGLLLIDIQNDYFPGGKMELEGMERASLQARRLLDFFRTR
jgi:nicotinamidase-related amidase